MTLYTRHIVTLAIFAIMLPLSGGVAVAETEAEGLRQIEQTAHAETRKAKAACEEWLIKKDELIYRTSVRNQLYPALQNSKPPGVSEMIALDNDLANAQRDFDQVQMVLPSGFNPQNCSGSIRKQTGEYTYGGGHLIQYVLAGTPTITFTFTPGNGYPYPIQVKWQQGAAAMTGVYSSASAPGKIVEISFPSLNIDKTTGEYQSRSGKIKLGKNELVAKIEQLYRSKAIQQRSGSPASLSDFFVALATNGEESEFVIEKINEIIILGDGSGGRP